MSRVLRLRTVGALPPSARAGLHVLPPVLLCRVVYVGCCGALTFWADSHSGVLSDIPGQSPPTSNRGAELDVPFGRRQRRALITAFNGLHVQRSQSSASIGSPDLHDIAGVVALSVTSTLGKLPTLALGYPVHRMSGNGTGSDDMTTQPR